jgi:hypothetical protein
VKDDLGISVLFDFFVDLGARLGPAIRKILLGQSESVTLMETGKVSPDCVSAARAGSFCVHFERLNHIALHGKVEQLGSEAGQSQFPPTPMLSELLAQAY